MAKEEKEPKQPPVRRGKAWEKAGQVGLILALVGAGGVAGVVGKRIWDNLQEEPTPIVRPAAASPTEGARLVPTVTATPFVRELLAGVTPTATRTPEARPTATPRLEPTRRPAVVPATPRPAEGVARTDWLQRPYDFAGGIPYSGSEWNGDVAPDEIEVFTGGPMSVRVVDQGREVVRRFPGGETRGTVILFVGGGERVNPVRVTDVWPGANWHGAYRPVNPREDWRALLENRISAMGVDPNCTSGTGCQIVDFLVVNAATGEIIAEGTR